MTPADRQRQNQREPDPRLDFSQFPARAIARGTTWWRNHGPDGPWWFASDSDGRFNLPQPDGTLYLASSRAVAVMELVGPDHLRSGRVPEAVVHDRVVSKLILPHAVRAAKLGVRRAAVMFRASVALIDMTPYTVPQAWAAMFRSKAFGGVAYQARHGGSRDHALAVFGKAGARDWSRDPSPVPVIEALPPGVRVVRRPTSTRSLHIIDKPSPSGR